MHRLQCVETHLDNHLTPARKRNHHQASQMPHSQVTVQIDDGRFAPFDAPLDTVSTLPGYRFRLSTEYKILTITHGAIGSPARRTPLVVRLREDIDSCLPTSTPATANVTLYLRTHCSFPPVHARPRASGAGVRGSTREPVSLTLILQLTHCEGGRPSVGRLLVHTSCITTMLFHNYTCHLGTVPPSLETATEKGGSCCVRASPPSPPPP